MGVAIKVLYDQPQREIASLLGDRLSRCRSASLVAGFATLGGIAGIAGLLCARPGRLEHLVVGAGTFSAYEALDSLVAGGVPLARLFVHLGMSRSSGGKKNPFQRFHPMLHSKVYLLDMGSNKAAAFVGSHNLTVFALHGLNGEAGILLEGDASDPAFADLRQHVTACVAGSVPYDPAMKGAYAWWTAEFVDGLRREIDDAPRDAEARRTIVVLAAHAPGRLPKKDDVVYFEIPEALGAIQSLQAEVHIYLFDPLPQSPDLALSQLGSARACLSCKTAGIELGRGAQELRADWYISDRRHAELLPAPQPFRPSTRPGMQQVRVVVSQEKLVDRFEYLFDRGGTAWAPVFDEDGRIEVVTQLTDAPETFQRKRSEEGPWYPVRALRPAESEAKGAYELALLDSAPASGSFILMSPRRRRSKP